MLHSKAQICKPNVYIADSNSGDLILASREALRPQLSFYANYELEFDFQLQHVLRPEHPLRGLGKGFDELDLLVSVDNPASAYLLSLKSTLRRLAWYTLAVDDYLAARSEAQGLTQLGDERNFVHHSLLCLMPDLEHELEATYNVFELCQLSALIYSFLCVFPLPSAPFGRLSKQIRSGLSRRKFSDEWDCAPRLMMWIATMACIAAVGYESTRLWFVAVLDRCLCDLQIHSAQDFKEALSEFLWFPSTNDQDADDIWEELNTLRPFQSSLND
jgi:hypothetical protein